MGLSGQPCRTPDTDTRGNPCCPLIFTATVADPYKPWIACNILPCRPKRCKTCQRTGLDTRSYADFRSNADIMALASLVLLVQHMLQRKIWWITEWPGLKPAWLGALRLCSSV